MNASRIPQRASGFWLLAAGLALRRMASSQGLAASGALLLLLLASCQLTDHTEKDPNTITTEALNIPASGYDSGDNTDLPRFAFDSTTVNFGKVAQGAQVEKIFRFTNAGGGDLIITDVRTTCGCTLGKDWPKAPVRPGEGGSITVTFDSEGRSGLQDKTITVTGNTQPPTTVLLLKGEVVAPPGAPAVE